jgi:hypothetical protein
MEEVLPPQTMFGAGFEPPRVRQFTVFLENRVGRLQTLVRSLEAGTGKIVALSIQENADTALVRLICSDPDDSKIILKSADFSFSESELLVVELPQERAAAPDRHLLGHAQRGNQHPLRVPADAARGRAVAGAVRG